MDSKIPGNLLTTAMAVMPHTDVARALEMALSLDVPFWPQLPNYSYYEDMYVQAAEHFPGIVLDMKKRTLRFSMNKFVEELEETLMQFDDPAIFDISEAYSVVYHRFLALDLADRPAIRGNWKVPSVSDSTSWIRMNVPFSLMRPFERSCWILWPNV
ncbi:MAG: hypothetical protein Q8P24_08260 [Desulfobacterales bacterium]|nr:hypothetical protein [Desulfobacterales bacterium]